MSEKYTYNQYIDDVINNKIITGELIKLAVIRFNQFKSREDLYFNEKKVHHVIDFISIIKHYLGKHANSPFILQPWQQFIIASIFGYYKKSDNRRLTNNVYIQIGRKNGKSAFAASISLYLLLCDGEAAAEVIFAANSREQAKILLEISSNFAKSIDPKNKYIKIYRNDIKVDTIKAHAKIVSSDASKLDGLNISSYIVDEYHEAKDSKIVDVLSSSQGMRVNPLGIIITTAGFNLYSPCYQLYNTAIEILKGVKQDDTFFAAIFQLDENDDFTDPNNYIKANPNLDITIQTEFINNQIIKAKNNPSEEIGVKTKLLNIWCQTSETWINNNLLLESTQNINIEDFKNEPCYIGVDLSAVSDITAVSAMWYRESEDKYYFKSWAFLPQSALNESENKELYKKWNNSHELILTPGNVVDYDYILSHILILDKITPVQAVYYDSWNSTQFAINATDAGVNMQPFSQTIGNFNKPTKELTRLIKSGKIVIDNNEITRFCFGNVVLKFDHNSNAKPTKSNNKSKIDIVIAMLQALGGYLQQPKFDLSIV